MVVEDRADIHVVIKLLHCGYWLINYFINRINAIGSCYILLCKQLLQFVVFSGCDSCLGYENGWAFKVLESLYI